MKLDSLHRLHLLFRDVAQLRRPTTYEIRQVDFLSNLDLVGNLSLDHVAN